MTNSSTWPFFLKYAQVVLGIIGTFFVIYIGREILAPLLFSMLLAILLNPVFNFLQRKGCNRVVAILLTLLMAFIVLAALVIFLGSQVIQFRDSLPEIKSKFSELFSHFTAWLSDTFNIQTKQIKEWMGNAKESQAQGTTGAIGSAAGSLAGFVVSFIIIPVYVFLLLFYKPLLLEFLHRIFPASQEDKVGMVLEKVKTLVQSYLVGLMIEASIIAVLDSVGLLLIGIEHAILFGVIAAFFNLIPYIGGIIATSLPAAMALTSDNPNKAFLVVGLFALVQLIDNNFLIPKIVASKVKINALVSIFVVILGGALWGVPGMFFAIPVTAIAKVICDSVEPLQSLGFLMGDNMPPAGKSIFKKRRRAAPPKKTGNDKPIKK